MKGGRSSRGGLRIEGLHLEEENIQLINSKKDSLDSPLFSPLPFISTHSTGFYRLRERCRRSNLPKLFPLNLKLSIPSLLIVILLLSFIPLLLLRNQPISTFSDPLIPNPTSPETLVNPSNLPFNSTNFQDELDSRLLSLGLPISILQCTFDASSRLHYSNLSTSTNFNPTSTTTTTFDSSSRSSSPKILIAINLYNSEAVIPTLTKTLLSLSNYLGRDSIHISIYENGSRDGTTLALGHFAAILTRMKIEHTILSDPTETDWKNVDRIAQLAVYRNLVLQPLYESTSNFKVVDDDSYSDEWDTVLFVNDVFVCVEDILELLWQRKEQSASAACAMDWRKSGISWFGLNGIKFYDNWVSRTIKGEMFRNRFDILAETRNGIDELFDQPGSEFSRSRFQSGVPVAVYSCWNGMIALDAEPFLKPDENGEVVRFRSALNQPKQCAASECKTIARDFWARGFNRWMVIPSVRVTYDESVYNHPLLKDLIKRKFTTVKGISEWIDWSSIVPPTSVICYGWVKGFHIDLPYRRTRESP